MKSISSQPQLFNWLYDKALHNLDMILAPSTVRDYAEMFAEDIREEHSVKGLAEEFWMPLFADTFSASGRGKPTSKPLTTFVVEMSAALACEGISGHVPMARALIILINALGLWDQFEMRHRNNETSIRLLPEFEKDAGLQIKVTFPTAALNVSMVEVTSSL